MPVFRFVRYDPRASSIVIYGLLLGVFLNGMVACVLPMFAETTGTAAVLLTANGFGNLAGGLSFGRVSNTIGRLGCMLLAATMEVVSMAMFASFMHLGMSGPPGDDVGLWVLRLAAAFFLGLGNSWHFSNLAASIAASCHDKAQVSFSTQQTCIALGTIPAFIVLPELSRGWALGTCGIILALSAAFLVSRPAFFRTLLLVEEGVLAKPEAEVAL